MKSVYRRRFLATGLAAGALPLFSIGRARAALPGEITIDYAYYSPLSLLLKNSDALKQVLPDTKVNFVLSQGSNKALEFLRGRAIILGSAAGSATLLARANGTPVQTVYVNDHAETTALVVKKVSPIQTVADLKGKKVAVTPGTEPYAFLLQALSGAGLKPADITIVPLQHPLGHAALTRGDVDAWAGLDPFMAEGQLQNGDRLFYRNPAIITPNVLVVREDYATKQPELILKLIQAYEIVRKQAIANPDLLVTNLVKEASLTPDVAKLEIGRQSFTNPVLDDAGLAKITADGKIYQQFGFIKPSVDVAKTVAELNNRSFTDQLAHG
ncbi:aliphatic sulfonate ABC transporter substrate-binding protein [Acidisoma silvae]|uniref:Putative aliphatic sulfonates-binding protein n=1 Tax=Acidisoma silvae TaxID=2802396 RepID=A0A963YRJ5_9PROT|nr:aliphatic sulfonate ABC transporter substrate-binding protein [Acidisoma silvae]MCB8875659.1 aliphatic sulfonate ABC transporter substrate-binding protein [Acidisoma silvae]